VKRGAGENLPIFISYPSEWGFGAVGGFNGTGNGWGIRAVHSMSGVESVA